MTQQNRGRDEAHGQAHVCAGIDRQAALAEYRCFPGHNSTLILDPPTAHQKPYVPPYSAHHPWCGTSWLE